MNDVLKEYDKGAIKNPKNFSSDNEYAWYIQTYWRDKKLKIE